MGNFKLKPILLVLSITAIIQSYSLQSTHAAVVKIVPNYTTCDSFANKAFKEFLFSKYTKALCDFDSALIYCPGGKDTLAQIYTYRAATEIGLGKYKNALNDCDTALKLNNKRGDSYMFKGAAEAFMGNYQTAIRDANEADSVIIDTLRIKFISIVDVYHRDFYEALDTQKFKMYDTLDGIKYNIYDLMLGSTYNMSDAEYGLKSINDAFIFLAKTQLQIKAYGKPHGQDSTLAALYSSLGNYYSGIKYSRISNPDSSDKYYTKAISIDSSNATFYEYSGRNYSANDNDSLAIKDYTKAIDIYKKKHDIRGAAYAYAGRGASETGLKQYQKAINDETTAIVNSDDEEESAYYNRGYSYWCLNKKEDAKHDFNKVISDTVGDELIKAFAYLYLGDTIQASSIIDEQLDSLTGSLFTSDEATDPYTEAFSTITYYYYTASDLLVLVDKPKEAIHYLKIAMDFGGLTKNDVLTDPEFDSIKNTSEFKELMKDYYIKGE